MKVDTNGLEVLEPPECAMLLGSVPIGRVVFTDRALPAVQPVAFVLDDRGDVIIRTQPGSKLAAATRGAIVAFEVDDFDVVARTGWSVTAVGPAGAVRDPAERERLSRLPLRPWLPGPCEHYIRIQCRQLSGRRILPVPAVLADRVA